MEESNQGFSKSLFNHFKVSLGKKITLQRIYMKTIYIMYYSFPFIIKHSATGFF